MVGGRQIRLPILLPKCPRKHPDCRQERLWLPLERVDPHGPGLPQPVHLNGRGQTGTYVQLAFRNPTVDDVRLPTTESPAFPPRQKIDPSGQSGNPSDRTDKPISGPCKAERFSAPSCRLCAAQGHLDCREKSVPNEQPA